MDNVYILKYLAYVGIVLCLLGIIGNAFSVYVLSKMNSASLRLLKYLNVVDIVLLVIVCSLLTMIVLWWKRASFEHHFVILCTSVLFLTVQTFETYLTVLIAFVRCLAVAMPFRFSTCMRDSVQSKLLVAIAVFSLLFNLPLYLLLMPNSITLRMAKFQIMYLSLVFSFILPLLVITICNVILVVSRCRMRSVQSQNDRCRSRDRRHSRGAFQLTCLVLAITAMFIATHAPVGVFKCLRLTYQIDITVQFIGFQILITIIYSATNFILYCCFGSEFRSTLISLCKKPCFTRTDQPMPVSPV
ncbi:probable G-protein coupled receptor frpr-1 [Haliotis rufescens]|uniref:probable G-protein coupled receptor frpr-1 n=1 Tax=Haliotis rufescens TaxID=6454 RepID=UPI001EB07B86|nr:probable G-protein coupled receptor frpr-1 [Haliotis rufescens]